MVDVTWSSLKSFLDQNTIQIKFIEFNSRYEVYGFDSDFSVRCMIKKGTSDCTEFETNYKSFGNKVLNNTHLPFADKKIGSKKLFRRKHGISSTIAASSSGEIAFSVPYAQAKITKAEIMGCELGDTVDFTIHDDASGTYTTVPNYQLNQFGFDVQLGNGSYMDESQYDADLYIGMVIKITYQNNGVSSKDIGVNITLHEVV